jgi:AcrR family transcriptional regulator
MIEFTEKGLRPKQIAILDTAFELFCKHGFQRVSVEEICSTAGVSKMTFYKYYPGKEDLVLTLIRKIYGDLDRDVRQLLASDLDIKAKFDRVSLMKQEMMEQIGDEFLRSIMVYPPAKQYLDELTQSSWSNFNNLMEAEKLKGNINPKIDMNFLLVVMLELNKLYAEDRFAGFFENSAQLIEQMNELIFSGILSRE